MGRKKKVREMKTLELSLYLKLDPEMISLTISVGFGPKKKKKSNCSEQREKSLKGGKKVEIQRQLLNG